MISNITVLEESSKLNDKIQITICLGSLCFSRKNKDVVSTIQDFIAIHKLNNEAKIKGGHCFGKCTSGPIMLVNYDMRNYDRQGNCYCKELSA